MNKVILCASLLMVSGAVVGCNETIRAIASTSGESELVVTDSGSGNNRSGLPPSSSGSGLAPSATPAPTPTLVSAPVVSFSSGSAFRAVLSRFRRH